MNSVSIRNLEGASCPSSRFMNLPTKPGQDQNEGSPTEDEPLIPINIKKENLK